MRTLAWPGDFREVAWPDIATRLRAFRSQELQPMLDIVESVLTSGAHAHLAGLPSMTDLIVAARPVSEPPVEVVIVRLQWGTVTIEHVSHNGRNDKISRPASGAVQLFWRFMIEKFGVHPTQTGAPDR